MQTLHHVLAVLVILLGVIHIVSAPAWFDAFAMRVMWYVAQGLMGIVIGFVNIMALRHRWQDSVSAALCHTANLLGLTFAVIYSLVDPAAPSYLAIAIFTGLVVTGISAHRTVLR